MYAAKTKIKVGDYRARLGKRKKKTRSTSSSSRMVLCLVLRPATNFNINKYPMSRAVHTCANFGLRLIISDGVYKNFGFIATKIKL